MRALLILVSVIGLASCVESDGALFPPGTNDPLGLPTARNQGQPAPYPGSPSFHPPQRNTAPPPTQSDYIPPLRDEYRAGYEIGAQDRSYGYPANYQRAYQRFGHGYESYFQEGYNDGYEARAIRH